VITALPLLTDPRYQYHPGFGGLSVVQLNPFCIIAAPRAGSPFNFIWAVGPSSASRCERQRGYGEYYSAPQSHAPACLAVDTSRIRVWMACRSSRSMIPAYLLESEYVPHVRHLRSQCHTIPNEAHYSSQGIFNSGFRRVWPSLKSRTIWW